MVVAQDESGSAHVIRQETDDIDEHDQANGAQGLQLEGRLQPGAPMQAVNDEQVAGQGGEERRGEGHSQWDQSFARGLLSVQLQTHRDAVHFCSLVGDQQRCHGYGNQGPQREADDVSVASAADLQRPHGVDHGQVAIPRHARQEVQAGVHVDVKQKACHSAGHLAKGPVASGEVVGGPQREDDHVGQVRHSQVDQEDVRWRGGATLVGEDPQSQAVTVQRQEENQDVEASKQGVLHGHVHRGTALWWRLVGEQGGQLRCNRLHLGS